MKKKVYWAVVTSKSTILIHTIALERREAIRKILKSGLDKWTWKEFLEMGHVVKKIHIIPVEKSTEKEG